MLVSLIFFNCENKQKQQESVTEDEKAETSESGMITQEEIEDGWQLLFDGKTKNGWHVYNDQSDGSAWEVNNGVLHLNPKEIRVTPVPGAGDLTQAVGGGDLATDEEFDNFHLKLEYKVGDPSNSGIMIFVNEIPEHDYPWQTGPEIQVMHQMDCADTTTTCPGDLYGLIAGPRDLEISDDWNAVEVIANNGSLEVHMNERLLYKTTMWDDNWKSMIAETKFTAWPDFGTYTKGKIVLQDHGHEVQYRNVKIKRL